MAAKPPRLARTCCVPVIFRADAVPRLATTVGALDLVVVDIEPAAAAATVVAVEAACFFRS
jgi:hypothetical protein